MHHRSAGRYRPGAAPKGRCSRAAAGALLAGLLLCACSADLHESVGPRVAVPNVSGRIVRAGAGLDEVPVALTLVPGDATLALVETNRDGEYVFSDVGAGSLMVAAESDQVGDFADVAYSFVFFSADTALEIPDLDLSMAALESRDPPDGEQRSTPNLFAPVTFAWQWAGEEDPRPRFRVRFYTLSGEQIWLSEKTRDMQVNWNGIGSEGEFESVPVSSGEYRWRLRVYGEDGREFTTEYRRIVFE